VVDRRAKKIEPGRAKAYLIAKSGGCPLCGAPHAGDHDAEYDGDLTEQHVRPLHDLASDFSCADSSWKKRHNNVLQASGSVPGQCRSKTAFSRKVEQKDRVRAVSNQRKTPQAKAHCGVLSGKTEVLCRIVCNQNLGGSFSGV
jgi:hypothetical protein